MEGGGGTVPSGLWYLVLSGAGGTSVRPVAEGVSPVRPVVGGTPG